MCKMNAIIFGIVLIIGQAIGSGAKVCHQCSGINCQRTGLNKTETCVNDMDVCVTVFEGLSVQAQGCLQSLEENLRRKCTQKDGDLVRPAELPSSQQCAMCLTNMCNNMGPRQYECIQCDSDKDERCRSNPLALMTKPCPISRANNAYCYLSDDGKRVQRGCAGMVEEQRSCLGRKDCILCSPMDLKACNAVPLEKDADESGNDNNGGNNGGNGGNNGGNDGNNGGNGGNNGGNDGNNGGNDGNNGGNDGNNGGNDGNNGGGNGGGNNSSTSTISFSKTTLAICISAVALGMTF